MTTTKGHLGSVTLDGSIVRVAKTGRGEQSIPLSAISSVSIEPAGIGMRAIRFSVGGGTLAGPVKAVGSHKDMASDPFALTFRKKALPKFQALVDEIQNARASL